MGVVQYAGVLWLVIAISLAGSGIAPCAQSSSSPSDDLPTRAIAILHKHCVQCHGPDKQQGGLRLDQPALLLRGGKHDSVVQPASRLLQRVTSSEARERMPPQGNRLSQEDVETLRQWLSAGAPWINRSKVHWAFQPIRRAPIPQVKQSAWVRQPFDAYILHRLEHLTLQPSPVADARTLIRRLHLDLVGTLPTIEAVDAFAANPSDENYGQIVDRLLASTQFGERWARHWLDLARYGDSDGLEHDEPRPHAHRYREWVIDAYNSDMPYDRFTVEQLAGDLISPHSKDQLLAAGFHRQTLRHNTGEMYQEEYRIKNVKDRVNTTGITWLGMTIGCAECHAHKYDPLSQTEYYQLFAFFNDADEIDLEDRQLATFMYRERETRVQFRGNPQTLGNAVVPGVPAFLPPLSGKTPRATRLDLAKWLVSDDHPLTARVEANRIWQHLFGAGLASTPDDLGLHGALPRYPETLDWLASELKQNGWSRKKLIKTIVQSATYRQNSRFRPDLLSSDPANGLLSRQNRFRVEAEIVHDISLQVAGLLQTGYTGGVSFQPLLPHGLDTKLINNNKMREPSEWDNRHRRGVYIHVQRTYQHPLLQTFDAPDGNQSCASRVSQMTPAQSLSMLNDPLFSEAALELGKRMSKENGSPVEQLTWGFRLCMGRSPEPEELNVLQRLLEQQIKSFPSASWKGVAAVLLNMEAFTTRE